MQALLEIKAGEETYKAGTTDWQRDSDGAVMFKIISKKRADSRIELVYYSQRGDGRKIIMEDIIIDEADFDKVVATVEESLGQFFPGIKLKVEKIDIYDSRQVSAAPVGQMGEFSLLFNNIVKCRWMSLVTWIKDKLK